MLRYGQFGIRRLSQSQVLSAKKLQYLIDNQWKGKDPKYARKISFVPSKKCFRKNDISSSEQMIKRGYVECPLKRLCRHRMDRSQKSRYPRSRFSGSSSTHVRNGSCCRIISKSFSIMEKYFNSFSPTNHVEISRTHQRTQNRDRQIDHSRARV